MPVTVIISPNNLWHDFAQAVISGLISFFIPAVCKSCILSKIVAFSPSVTPIFSKVISRPKVRSTWNKHISIFTRGISDLNTPLLTMSLSVRMTLTSSHFEFFSLNTFAILLFTRAGLLLLTVPLSSLFCCLALVAILCMSFINIALPVFSAYNCWIFFLLAFKDTISAISFSTSFPTILCFGANLNSASLTSWLWSELILNKTNPWPSKVALNFMAKGQSFFSVLVFCLSPLFGLAL